MTTERQLPGGAFANESTTAQRQIPGGSYLNEYMEVQVAVPISDVSAGNWTPSVGNDLYATIDEAAADDSDFDTATDPSSETFEVKLTSLTDPLTDAGHRLWYRLAGVDGVCDFTVALREGAATQIASWNHNSVGAVTTFSQTLTAEEAAAITDYTDLRLRVTATKV